MVAGVYDADPKMNSDANLYDTVSFDKVLSDKLKVMDATAVVMCRDNNLPLRVINIMEPETLVRAMGDSEIGTLVTA